MGEHAILIVSSFTISRARRDFLRDDLPNFRHWWYVTTALGFLFLIGQLIAWRQLGPRASISDYQSKQQLLLCLHRSARLAHSRRPGRAASVAFHKGRRLTLATSSDVVAMYWHFMDGLWVFLFLLLTLGR